jgi:hypothetical protein
MYALPVSMFAEFQLRERVDIQDSAKAIEVRIYDSHDILVGILDSAVVLDLVTDIHTVNTDKPSKFRLVQYFPNPFNPGTTIAYELPEQSSVKVIIYDLQGLEINTFSFVNTSAGYHELLWDGKIFDEPAKMTLLK